MRPSRNVRFGLLRSPAGWPVDATVAACVSPVALLARESRQEGPAVAQPLVGRQVEAVVGRVAFRDVGPQDVELSAQRRTLVVDA